MDSAELTEWMAFATLEPIGGHRGDVQAATVASTLANCHRGKDTRPFKAADFIPPYGEPAPSPEDRAAALAEKLHMAMGTNG